MGTPTDFVVTQIERSTTRAEYYFLDTGYLQKITDRFFWNAGFGYKRDLFSGVERYLSGRAGAGYVFWEEKDRGEFRGALQLTLNNQKETVPDPEVKDTFVGLRAVLEYRLKFGPGRASAFASKLALEENLQVTEDFRIEWPSTLTVAMTDRFALQVGFTLRFRNLPALLEIPLFTTDPGTGAPRLGTVLTEYEKLDTLFTVGLVINWGAKPAKDALPKP